MPRRKRTTALRVAELGPGSRVYAYLRDSGGAAQERSVAEQRSAIERQAAARGWVVVDWFVDAATASGDYAQRHEFGALLDACREAPPPVAGVVTYSFARFGRDEFDSQFYRLELRRNGVQVTSVADPVPAGPFAMVFEAFIDWKNRVFLDDMSRHVREGLRANVTAGLAPGGSPPTGYRAEPVLLGAKRDGRPRMAARWVVDPELGPRVTEAFRLAAEGLPYETILQLTGLPLRRTSLRSLLLNRSYLGLYKLGAEEFPGLAPLVDAATWDRVQARFTTRAEQARGARRLTSAWLLSGLATCGECGALMWGDVDRRRPAAQGRYYRCKTAGCAGKRVTAGPVDELVVRTVLDEVLTPERWGALLAALQASLADPGLGEELAGLGPQIGGLRHAIGTLLDALEAGGGAETQRRLAQREAELTGLEERRRALEARLALGQVQVSALELGEIVAGMRAQVTSEEVVVARHALRQYVARVVLWADGRVRVEGGAVAGDVFAGNGVVPPRGFVMLPVLWFLPVDICGET